ncbi:MAG: gas vesicle protein [Thaumarchaeota archaeon]|nr:gas vesicle protein [Nitrososphaerota archaeon]
MSSKQLTQQQLTIVDLVDRILDKGVVLTGDITVSIVGVDLLSLKINLVIASLETAKRYGIKLPWEKWEKIQPKKIIAKSTKR